MDACKEFTRLLEIMHRLRAECPWDRSQTHQSLRTYLLEETYEVLQALDHGETGKLCEELGDLALQIVFHAEVASETGNFDIADVLGGINDKLVRRHPHVFADAVADTPDEVRNHWQNIKAHEEQRGSLLDGVPDSLPALQRARRVLATIKEAGADPLELRDPVQEAERWLKRLAECRSADGNGAAEHATGSLCLAVVALAARAGVNPEDALRQVVDRLTRAFRSEEAEIIDSGMLFGQVPAPQLRRMAERLLAECEKPGK